MIFMRMKTPYLLPAFTKLHVFAILTRENSFHQNPVRMKLFIYSL